MDLFSRPSFRRRKVLAALGAGEFEFAHKSALGRNGCVPPRHDSTNNLLRQLRRFGQRLLRRIFALADQRALELEPRALLVHHTIRDADIQDASLLVDALIEDDVELGANVTVEPSSE